MRIFLKGVGSCGSAAFLTAWSTDAPLLPSLWPFTTIACFGADGVAEERVGVQCWVEFVRTVRRFEGVCLYWKMELWGSHFAVLVCGNTLYRAQAFELFRRVPRSLTQLVHKLKCAAVLSQMFALLAEGGGGTAVATAPAWRPNMANGGIPVSCKP